MTQHGPPCRAAGRSDFTAFNNIDIYVIYELETGVGGLRGSDSEGLPFKRF